MALNRPDPHCAAVRELLPLLVGEDLEADRAGFARDHLRGCFACARELGAELAARRALTAVSRPEVPRGEDAFFAQLESDIHARLVLEAAAPRRARGLRLAKALAMAALFLGGLGLVRWMQPIEPRLLGNDPLAVPLRAGAPGSAPPEAFENLSRVTYRPRPVGVPRFGLEARTELERWLPGNRVLRPELPSAAGPRTPR